MPYLMKICAINWVIYYSLRKVFSILFFSIKYFCFRNLSFDCNYLYLHKANIWTSDFSLCLCYFFKRLIQGFFSLWIGEYGENSFRIEIKVWHKSECLKCANHPQLWNFGENANLLKLCFSQIHKNSGFYVIKILRSAINTLFQEKNVFLLTISNTGLNLNSFKAQVLKIYEQDSNIILFYIYISKM